MRNMKKIKARFWWKVRHEWHKSSVYAECYWPLYSSHYFLRWNRGCIKHLLKRNLLWLDFKVFWKRAWMGFRVIQPFGCKSHWRRDKKRWYQPQWWYEFSVNVCEWLEYKARSAEDPNEWEHFNPFKKKLK